MPLSLDRVAWRQVAHVCVDMQRMFEEETPWHTPWVTRTLPAIEAIVAVYPERTVFTRFIPPVAAEAAHGAWQAYYRDWEAMTRERLTPGLIDLCTPLARHVPPAHVVDKSVYSPWLETNLHRALRARNVETLVITGGETEVCVSATVLGAIDHGYSVVLPVDALCSSADETHDAMLRIYRNRFSSQLVDCTSAEVMDIWRREG
ncbi:cysteine hydrolase [Devosia geojensis]|uniref:Cysteine hydrolase n=1 Tax=Devosia geojensis TaxID=443610 RepID=A0A0F5FV85_9HYPH|nr:cysteine hydrolase [Devosia geojensis]KKB12738.1 cysteine hydrolase [Devosia geojensis]